VKTQQDRLHTALNNFKTTLSGYYINLSLVASLLSGFTLAILVAASGIHASGKKIERFGKDVTNTYATILAISGGGALTLLIWCVADCILIDATIRKVRTGKQALQMLGKYPVFLGNPLKLIMGGIMLNAVELNMYVGSEYSVFASHIIMGVMILMAVVVLRNVHIQSKFLNGLANDEAGKTQDGKTQRFGKKDAIAMKQVREELVSLMWTGHYIGFKPPIKVDKQDDQPRRETGEDGLNA